MRWRWAPTRRRISLAVAVGFALRLTWALTATTTPKSYFMDAANYLRVAGEVADFHTPTFGGLPSALYASGYPVLLVPAVWLSRTGLVSLPMAAALLNVLAGSASIALVSVVARRWIGPRAAVPTAWFLALAPGLIYFTSAAVGETMFIVALLGVLAWAGRVVDTDRRTVRFAALGLLAGYAFLIRSPGVVLFLTPLLMIRARDRSWRAGIRPTFALLAGACVLLVPWTFRNGLQVGVWTPGSTANAIVMCMGHWDGANGVNNESLAQYQRCYPDSPWDNAALPYEPGTVPPEYTLGTPDEGKWYRRTTSEAATWAVTHPVQEVKLVVWKTVAVLGSESTAMPIARNFQDTKSWPTPYGAELLNAAADIWLWIVLALAGLGLVRLRSCRAAIPIWGTAVALMVMIYGGVAQAQYKLPTLPLLAVLAGAVVASLAEPRLDADAEPDAGTT